MNDISNLRPTIVPKSDQLNAEELLSGPMTVTVTDVRLGGGDDQPVVVKYEGDNGKPFKPCKTMRKVLIFAWGEDGRAWVGKSMTLYNDPAVKFGGMDVGGIRISHMTDIERDEIRLSLNTARGKKGLYVIQRLARPAVPAPFSEQDALMTIAASATIEALQAIFEATWQAAGKGNPARDRLKAAYDLRKTALAAPPETDVL